MSKKFIVEGAKLVCDKGSTPTFLKVNSQGISFSKEKVATEADKELYGNFGSCGLCNNNACVAQLLQWKITEKKLSVGGNSLLIEDSYIKCNRGGTITIKDPNQNAAALGKTEDNLDKYYPKLHGDVIFVNGFHSDFFENIGQVLRNAVLDKNHENLDKNSVRHTSAQEKNTYKKFQRDIFTNQEARKILLGEIFNMYMEELEEKDSGKYKVIKEALAKGEMPLHLLPDESSYIWNIVASKLRFLIPFSFNNDVSKFWKYWNNKTNNFKTARFYCNYFNATGHDHYINGSHGLGSNGAHRIDHGIALGYAWAKDNWGIYPKDRIEEHSDDRSLKSYTPAYKPITVVGHSQGAAMGTGVALGIMYYAKELGWEKIALNVIYLGVHQPRGLYGEEYNNLIKDKVDFYEGNFNRINLFARKERKGKILNQLGEFFSTKHNKLLNNRGIYEHLTQTLGQAGWDEYKKHCVQFTFTNDRADFVILDGDIPEIKSACDPERNMDPFHLHFEFADGRKALSDTNNPKMYKKEITNSVNIIKEGVRKAKWYKKYMVNQRFNEKKIKKKYRINGEKWGFKEWKDINSVIERYLKAFDNYQRCKKVYKKIHNTDFYRRIRTDMEVFYRISPEGEYYEIEILNKGNTTPKPPKENFSEDDLPKELRISLDSFYLDELYAYTVTDSCYQEYRKAYAALQEAQLYAHFAPVAWFDNPKILSDFPEDDYGRTSIFDRICKAGEEVFYRLDMTENPDEDDMPNNTKIEAFEEKLQEIENRMIDVNIVGNEYIERVIDAYLKIEDPKEALRVRMEELYLEEKFKEKYIKDGQKK